MLSGLGKKLGLFGKKKKQMQDQPDTGSDEEAPMPGDQISPDVA